MTWPLTQPDETGLRKVTYLAQTAARLYPKGQMSSILPGSEVFQAPVYGTVFARRSEVVHRLHEGDRLILVPDPPGAYPPTVWVHACGGDVVGHLSPDINSWLAPWMLSGSCYAAEVAAVRGDEVASYKRLLITVRAVGVRSTSTSGQPS